MSLLQELIKEMAVSGSTGAGSIGGFAGSLFGGGVVDGKKARKKQHFLFRRLMRVNQQDESSTPKSTFNLKTLVTEFANTDPNNFDMSDVISKLNAAEKKSQIGKDTISFGLEDEEGQIIKVYVAASQAEEFEQALSGMLANADENEDDTTDSMEIAEVLHRLKDKFQIINVEWPTIEGDEEEEQEVDPENPEGVDGGEGLDGEGEMGELDGEGEMADLEGGEEGGLDSEEDAKSALQQVIDVLKADAEAKKAEAEAREAEAKQKEAEANATAAASKVKQEEQILDMEAYYKEKKEKDKEAQTLAKLAKWKHDTATEAETKLATEEEEEETDDSEREFSVDELASLITQHLRYNE